MEVFRLAPLTDLATLDELTDELSRSWIIEGGTKTMQGLLNTFMAGTMSCFQ